MLMIKNYAADYTQAFGRVNYKKTALLRGLFSFGCLKLFFQNRFSGINGHIAKLFFNTDELVVFGHTVGTRH